jgi:ABC-2 type transport system ATP-binding protein
MNLIIENLIKSYNSKTILNDINIQLNGGDIIGLLGKNGAGKSTFLNCLIDLVKPDSGRFIFDGVDTKSKKSQFKSSLGILSDVIPPISEFTGHEYLQFIGLLHNIDSETFIKRKHELISFFFEDDNLMDKSISHYSTGMKKLIGFCASVLSLPSLLLLDEPFSGLDILAVKKMLSFIENYHRSDRIILIASHDLSYLEKITNRIIVIDNSVMKFDESLDSFTQFGSKIMDDALYEILISKTDTVSLN